MITVNFKMTSVGCVDLDLPTPLDFAALLDHCADRVGYSAADCIGIKNGQVLKSSDVIVDGDSVDIYPALSGG